MPVREADHGSRALLQKMRGSSKVKVGVIGPRAAAGKAGSITGDTVVDIATIHEFGLGVPQRSFIAGYVDEQSQDIQRQVDLAAQRVLKGSDLERELGLIGGFVQAGMQERISNRIAPPLAQVTIDKKGSTVPLIDTGQLRSSITWEIDRG